MTDQEAQLVADWMRRYGLAMLWCRYGKHGKRFLVTPRHAMNLWDMPSPEWLVNDEQGERIATIARANARVQAMLRGHFELLKNSTVRRD